MASFSIHGLVFHTLWGWGQEHKAAYFRCKAQGCPRSKAQRCLFSVQRTTLPEVNKAQSCLFTVDDMIIPVTPMPTVT